MALPNDTPDNIGEQARIAAMAGNDQAATPLSGDEKALGAPAYPISAGASTPMTSGPIAPPGQSGGLRDALRNGPLGSLIGADNVDAGIGLVDRGINAARNAFTPGPLTSSVTGPRQAPSPMGPISSGGITKMTDAPQIPVGIAKAGQNPLTQVGDAQPSDSIDVANRNARAQIDAMDARDQQNQQAAFNQNAAGNNLIIANDRQNKADEALRLGRFNRAVYAPGAGAITGLLGQQARAEGGVAAAKAGVTAANNRNFIQEAAQGQNLTQSARQADIAARTGEQGLQKGGFEVKHAALLQSMAQRLVQAAPGSDEYEQLAGAYRTMLGKDANNYDVKVVPGGTRFDPQNPTVPIKDPDRVVVSNRNKPGEVPHMLDVNPPAAAAAKPAPEEGKVYKDANGNRAQYVNGKYVPL